MLAPRRPLREQRTARELGREPHPDGSVAYVSNPAAPDGAPLPGLAGTPDVALGDGRLTLPDDGPAIRLWLVPETS